MDKLNNIKINSFYLSKETIGRKMQGTKWRKQHVISVFKKTR